MSFDYFPLFPHFLISLIKFILWLKCFYRQKAGEGQEQGQAGGGCLFWKGRIGPCSITVSSFRLYRYILVGKDTCLSPHLELLHRLTDSIHEQALLDSLTRCHHWLDFIFKGFAHTLGFRPWSAISLGHTLYPEAGQGHRLGFLISWATGYPPLFSKVLAGISS